MLHLKYQEQVQTSSMWLTGGIFYRAKANCSTDTLIILDLFMKNKNAKPNKAVFQFIIKINLYKWKSNFLMIYLKCLLLLK